MNTMQKTLIGLPNYPEKIEDYIEIRKRYKELYDIVEKINESDLSQHIQNLRKSSLLKYFYVETKMIPENIDIGELNILYLHFYGGICNLSSIIDYYNENIVKE